MKLEYEETYVRENTQIMLMLILHINVMLFLMFDSIFH